MHWSAPSFSLFLSLSFILCTPPPSHSLLRVDENVIIGALPLLKSDVTDLHSNHGVRCVVNLCKEWGGHTGLYGAHGGSVVYSSLHSSPLLPPPADHLGIRHIRLPTVDFCAPSMDACRKAVDAIVAVAAAGGTTYVHCKAGRGRSLIVVLAYLITQKHMTPEAAQQFVQQRRPRVTKDKYKLPVVQQLYAEARL